jgi:glycosyltransferase involved in cell wall biosynthesis
VLRKELDKLLDWVRSEPKPDLVSITNSMLIGLARPLDDALGRPVCCTLQGEDLFLEGLVEPYKSRALEMIRGHVRQVPRFIAVSEYYASFMAGYLQIPPDKLSVVPIGVNTKDFDKRASRSDDIFRVGYLARIAPEKGLQLLADAYAIFRRRVGGAPVRLEAAGYMAPAQQKYLDQVKRSLAKAGIGGDFSYRGVVDRGAKVEFLRQIDVLSVPATYDEPKGFFLLEAMACGVPVVQPRRGSFTEIVEKTGGGLLVKPDDPQSLADGLHTLWRDHAQRQQLGRRGFDGVRAHYTIQRSTDRFLAVCNDLIRGA